MNKHINRLLNIIILALILLLSPDVTFAQKRTSRLYIPLSGTAEIIVENNDKKLVVKDYLNSTRQIIEDSSLLRQNYSPYGHARDKPIAADKQFTGHKLINGTDVYNAKNRFYNSGIGSFIQPDSAEGPNRYAYVGGNPITFHDLSGNQGGNSTRRWLGGLIEVTTENVGQRVQKVAREIQMGVASLAKNPNIANSNQDALFCYTCPNGAYTIGVFDGVGGNAGGREASTTARDVIGGIVYHAQPRNAEEASTILRKAYQRANDVVAGKAASNSSLQGMATTGTVAWVLPDGQIVLASVGDTRAYGLNAAGSFDHLTLDDSAWLQMLGDEQSMRVQKQFANATSANEVVSNGMFWQKRNAISKALGWSGGFPQLRRVSPVWGIKRLLITSDGIHDPLTDLEILNVLMCGNDPTAIASGLIHRASSANSRGVFRAKNDDKSSAVILFP